MTFISTPLLGTQVSPRTGLPTGATFHRVIASITMSGLGSSVTFEDALPADQGTVQFDIAPSARAYAARHQFSFVTGTDAAPSMRAEVRYYDEYFYAGAPNRVELASQNQTFADLQLGGYTDFERRSGRYTTADQDTLRPATSPAFAVEEQPYVTVYSRASTASTISGRNVNSAIKVGKCSLWVLPATGEAYHLQFVNTRGLVEGITAFCRPQEKFKGESTTIVRSVRETMTQFSRRLTIPGPSTPELLMSSGYVDKAWARWWTYEFGRARRHWILISGTWVPCSVSISDGAVVSDRSKAELLSVDFTVTPDLDGMLSL